MKKRKNKHLHKQDHTDTHRTLGALNIPMSVWKRGRRAAWNYWLVSGPKDEPPVEEEWISPYARKKQIYHEIKAWQNKTDKQAKTARKTQNKKMQKANKAAIKSAKLKVVATKNIPFSEWGCSVKREERKERITKALRRNREAKLKAAA